MPSAAQIGLDLYTKRQELAKLFADHTKADGTLDLTTDQVGEAKKRNDELGDLAKAFETATQLERIAEENAQAIAPKQRTLPPDAPGEEPAKPKSRIREFDEVLKASNYEAWRKSGQLGGLRIAMNDAESKTLVTLSGIAPNDDRQARIAGYPAATTTIDDLVLPGTTESNTVTYYEETAETDNTAARTEGSATTDNAGTFTLRTDTVRAITSWIPVTREALGDVPQFESFLRNRLPLLLAKKRTGLLISGDGIAPNPLGLMNRTNVQTQAKGADPTPDAIFKAMTLCSVTGDAAPTAVVLHPNDWQDIRLTRTLDGIYILGNPSDEAPPQIWGLTVRVTPQATENTGLVFSGPMFQIFRNGGVVFETSTEHSTYFTERSVALLIEERLAFACYRGQAVVKVTGI